MDLAGNEAEFSAEPFLGVLSEARQAGLKLTVHAGEWAGAANVREAIEVLQAERIGHGVRVLEDPQVVALACERGTAFEVCLTCNHQTGAVASLTGHPLLRMIEAGLHVSLGTDDPGISQITLSGEYRLACEQLAPAPGRAQRAHPGRRPGRFPARKPIATSWSLTCCKNSSNRRSLLQAARTSRPVPGVLLVHSG